MRAALAVLAAGQGERTGGPKAWRPVNGQPWLLRQLESLQPLGLQPVMFVVPVDPPGEFLPGLRAHGTLIENSRPELGPIHSLRLALWQLAARRLPVFVLPVDVPAPDVSTFEVLLEGLGDHAAAVPVYGKRGGHPVLLSHGSCKAIQADDQIERLDHWLHACGERVARIEVPDPGVLANRNQPEDFPGS